MDVVHLTLSVEEADSLHSILSVRRQMFIQFCQQHFHLTTPVRNYLAQLESLEAKLAQVSFAEYKDIQQAIANEAKQGDDSHEH